MSKSLTINTNPFTKQTNSLRGVPSGSTTPIDENVKWTPQTLTEEQKAQARENIGAAEAGETGATLYEFHYKRDTSVEPVEYYIDADGYEPKEGDLMTIIWDWPFRTDENDPDAEFKNPATLKNNSTNPSIYIKNAHEMETDYDEIDPAVNTRWTVKLEKVEDVWYAYNISTIVQPDWNTLDSTLPSYIKGKPDTSAPDFSKMSKIVFRNGNGTAGLVNNTHITSDIWNGNVYLDTTKVDDLTALNNINLTSGVHTIYYDTNCFPALIDWNKSLVEKLGSCNNNIHVKSQPGVIVTDMDSFTKVTGSANANTIILKNGFRHRYDTEEDWRGSNFGSKIVYVTFNRFLEKIGKNPNGTVRCQSLYVPKGMGRYYRILNPYIPYIYEYDSINCPENGTYYAPSSYMYMYSVPSLTGVELFEMDMSKYSEPFYIENIDNTSNTVTLSQVGTPDPVTLEYSADGTTWTEWGTTSSTPLTMVLNVNEKVYLRANTTKYANNADNYHNFTGTSKIGGNIASLLWGSDFVANYRNYRNTNAIQKLFYNNTDLKDASKLIISFDVTDHNTSLILTSFFEGCSNLEYGADVEMTQAIMDGMYKNCTSLLEAPEILLQYHPYTAGNNLFEGCSSMTKTKKLWFTFSLGTPCSRVFDGCSSLNYIDASGIINPNERSLSNWTRGVAATGTFVAAAGSNWSTGVNGIPTGWTVIYK